MVSTVDGTVNLDLAGLLRSDRLLLITVRVQEGNELLGWGGGADNDANRDYFCHHSYENNNRKVWGRLGAEINTLQLLSPN